MQVAATTGLLKRMLAVSAAAATAAAAFTHHLRGLELGDSEEVGWCKVEGGGGGGGGWRRARRVRERENVLNCSKTVLKNRHSCSDERYT
jgi:hypothetical protein